MGGLRELVDILIVRTCKVIEKVFYEIVHQLIHGNQNHMAQAVEFMQT